jgi:excisionase family DNA binding protein
LPQRRTLTVRETAQLLGISEWLLYDIIRKGEAPFPVVRVGKRRLVVPAAPLYEMLGVHPEAPS